MKMEDEDDVKNGKKSLGSSILRACGKKMDKKVEPEPKIVELSEDTSSDEGEDVYTVERVDGKKTFKDGIVRYFIKWKGWDE